MLSGAILTGMTAALALPACSESPPAAGPTAELRAEPLAPDELARAIRLGPGASVEGGWKLGSTDARLGGLSAILVERERLHLLSDRGWLWSAERPRPSGSVPLPTRWQVQELRADGRAPDSEALARDRSGRIVLALEGEHAIARLPGDHGHTRTVELAAGPLPAPLDALAGNQGVEALARLENGGLLAIAEGGRGALHPAVLLDLGPPRRLAYRSAPGFAPTGADQIGGWLLVVERRASALGGLSARVTATPVSSGDGLPDVIEPPLEIARLDGPRIPDNLEGIAAERGEAAGALRLWLVSDDNFSPLQRTLLLRLAWRPQALERASSRRLSRTSSDGSAASPTERR